MGEGRKSIRAAVLVMATCASVFLIAPSLPPSTSTPLVEDEPTVLTADPGAAADRVLAISIDGLGARQIRAAGRNRLPHMYRLVREGAGTLNARTVVESTSTLPNHTSMVTSRRVTAKRRGHGVTFNDDDPRRPRTVRAAAGRNISSVFSTVEDAGGRVGLYSTKRKFGLFLRSWPTSRSSIRVDADREVMQAARADLADLDLAFVHFGLVDRIGHRRGFDSPSVRRAAAKVDRLVGKLVDAVENRPALEGTVIVLTADHGGTGPSHRDVKRAANYTVPFTVWGDGVRTGSLYELSRGVRSPGGKRPGYGGKQPIRNADLGNVATDLLGLNRIPGSRLNRKRLVGHRAW